MENGVRVSGSCELGEGVVLSLGVEPHTDELGSHRGEDAVRPGLVPVRWSHQARPGSLQEAGDPPGSCCQEGGIAGLRCREQRALGRRVLPRPAPLLAEPITVRGRQRNKIQLAEPCSQHHKTGR